MYKKSVQNYKKKSIKDEETVVYKERIIDFTQDLLTNKINVEDLMPDIKYNYNNYINSCIQHFKLKDSSDLHDKEYNTTGSSINHNSDNDSNSNKIIEHDSESNFDSDTNLSNNDSEIEDDDDSQDISDTYHADGSKKIITSLEVTNNVDRLLFSCIKKDKEETTLDKFLKKKKNINI
jgi:hypothetical protein